MWIVKPGESTNRGNGIVVTDSMEEIKDLIQKNKKYRTHIIQKYIEKPLLFQKRKFDIRCFMLINIQNS